MPFAKNTAVTGFAFGLVSSSDRSDITTGTPVGYYTLDGGSQTAINDTSPVHEGNGLWSFDLLAAEMNGNIVALTFTHASAITVHFTIKTETKLVSALNDVAATDIVSSGAITTSSGAVGTVTAVTNQVTADMTAISGDSVAADNLELMYDGTGYTDENAPASRAQLGALSTGSAAISTIAGSAVITTGTPTLTYESTAQLDGVMHEIADVANDTEFYYEFDVGGDGVPVEFVWDGYAQSNGDSYAVSAYNWVTSVWDQIGEIAGGQATTATNYIFKATTANVGAGANIGVVRLQVTSSDGTHFATDRVLCSYAVVARSVGYALGSIWVDTTASNTNTENFVDGVADNPVSTWAAALTLSSQMGLNHFHIASGSSVTLTASVAGYVIEAFGVNLTLNGQSTSGALIIGCNITGNDSGINTLPATYTQCDMSDNVLGQHKLNQCHLTANVTLAEAGDYNWDYCSSFVAGEGTPDVTFPAGNAHLGVRHYSGGIEINAMAAGDVMSMEGMGQFKIAADCSGGSVTIRGAIGPITRLDGDAVTIIEDARMAADRIGAVVDASISSANIPTAAQINAEIVDVLKTDTIADLSNGAPPAAPTLEEAVMYLYSALRNKIDVDAGFKEFYNDSATLIWKKALSDSGTNYVEGKGQAGS